MQFYPPPTSLSPHDLNAWSLQFQKYLPLQTINVPREFLPLLSNANAEQIKYY
jgi:hypothetical protein